MSAIMEVVSPPEFPEDLMMKINKSRFQHYTMAPGFIWVYCYAIHINHFHISVKNVSWPNNEIIISKLQKIFELLRAVTTIIIPVIFKINCLIDKLKMIMKIGITIFHNYFHSNIPRNDKRSINVCLERIALKESKKKYQPLDIKMYFLM